MYQALYRKWRPQTFDDVVGQQHITETLKNQVRTDRLSHAYLFIGTRGTGKTTCAKILAKAVNCEQPVNGNPCNCCASCRGIDDGSIMDVVEMDAASNNGVDDVRMLRDEAIYSPANVKKRIYIVDEVHMLSKSAFNALLKILEEPPAHLMFILATTELHKVPATILSRCQRHSFKRIAAEDICARLQYVAAQEQIDLQPDAAMLLARMAEGGLRDALTLLDQCAGAGHVTVESVRSAIGLTGHLQTAELLQHIAEGDTAAVLTQFRALWQDGRDPSSLLDELSVLLRDVLLHSVARRGGSALLSGGYDDATLDAFAGAIAPPVLLSQIELIQSALSGMGQSVNAKLAAELCLIRLSKPSLQTDLSSILARLDALEQGGAPAAVKQAVPTAQPVKQPAAPPEPAPPAVEAPPWEPPAEQAPPPWEPEEPIPEPPAPEQTPPPWEPPVEQTPPPWEPDPIPEPTPREAPAPKPADAGAGADWEAILAAAQGQFKPYLLAVLKSPEQVRAVVTGDALQVEMSPSFASAMLNTPETARKLEAAAQAALGRDMHVTIREGSFTDSTSDRRSLEELTKFDIVSIE